jgi:transposase
MYVFSAADPLNGKVHYRIAPSNHKEDVVDFLKQMRSRYPVDNLVFRLDNHKSHKAHIVTQFAEDDGNMKLEHLNRYTSLKCNPIERLFKWFRRVVTHNQFFESITALKIKHSEINNTKGLLHQINSITPTSLSMQQSAAQKGNPTGQTPPHASVSLAASPHGTLDAALTNANHQSSITHCPSNTL